VSSWLHLATKGCVGQRTRTANSIDCISIFVRPKDVRFL
jgi:hypothetical protein